MNTGFRSGETCYQGDSNVTVRWGMLRLQARDVGTTIDCTNPYGTFLTRYTGGLVSTRGHFSQTYGRFEIRAKWPTARTPGVHGAFWLYPPNLKYGRWPASGEIDVAEWWSNDPTLVLPSLHYNDRTFYGDSGWHCRVTDVACSTATPSSGLPRACGSSSTVGLVTSGGGRPRPHWSRHNRSTTRSGSSYNMGVGIVGGTNPVTSETRLPATFTVDYAKAWR